MRTGLKLVMAENISLDKTTLTITSGNTQQLTATISPENTADKNVTWTSNNEAVATVDATGTVTGVAEGTATITVTTVHGSKTASCVVNVMEKEPTPPTGIDTTASSDSITVKAVGGSEFTGYQYSLDGVKWTETIESNVTYTFSGLLAAKDYTVYARTINKAGRTSINYTKTVKTSSISVESVRIDNTNVSMNVGEKVTLTATVTPSNATNSGVTWNSSNTAVATVTDGIIEAVGAGTATITVTTVDGSKTASCTVNVTKMISFTIDGTTYTAKEGITFRSMDLRRFCEY